MNRPIIETWIKAINNIECEMFWGINIYGGN